MWAGFFCRQDVSISIFGRSKEFSEVRGTSLMCNFGVHSRFLDVIYGVRPPNGSPGVIPANFFLSFSTYCQTLFRVLSDTETFPCREWRLNLGPLAPEAYALTTEQPHFRVPVYEDPNLEGMLGGVVN